MALTLSFILFAILFTGESSNAQQRALTVFAHRGFRGLHPENTIIGMQKALSYGAVLELDLAITRDKQVVVSHDPILNQKITLGPDGQKLGSEKIRIYQLDYKTLSAYDVGKTPNRDFPQQERYAAHIPLFSELVDSTATFAAARGINNPTYFIETKLSPKTDGIDHPGPKEFVDLMMQVVIDKGIAQQVIIQSFDYRTLQILRKDYPQIKVAMLAKDSTSLSNNLKTLGFVPEYYSINPRFINSLLVDQCHQLKTKLIVGNCNDENEISRVANLGVSGVISDFPLDRLPAQNLPDSIYSGKQGNFHMQGFVVDKEKKYAYFSFTDKLIKMDMSGRLIGSITGFAGHLGDLDISDDGKIYGSLEYKNDVIGKGIKNKLGVETSNEDGFYIAIFDGKRITRPNMNAEYEDLLSTVYIKEATNDYSANVKDGGREKPHRFGCSGIDGVAFAPAIGRPRSTRKFLYVAYGVYGDTARSDNDHQVILKYDVSDWGKYAQQLSQNNLHHSGPKNPLDKYFLKTGNTRYGIQNLAYDSYTGNMFAAVYKGAKTQFPNYDLFVIDGKKKPVTSYLQSDNQLLKVKILSLAEAGSKSIESNTRGWFFKWGSTGLFPLGNGLFYISHNSKATDGQQQSVVYKYRWAGDVQNPFVLAQ